MDMWKVETAFNGLTVNVNYYPKTGNTETLDDILYLLSLNPSAKYLFNVISLVIDTDIEDVALLPGWTVCDLQSGMARNFKLNEEGVYDEIR